MTEKPVPALEKAAGMLGKAQRKRKRVPVMRVSIAVCVAPTGARLRRRGKPMNFVPDGVHRMF